MHPVKPRLSSLGLKTKYLHKPIVLGILTIRQIYEITERKLNKLDNKSKKSIRQILKTLSRKRENRSENQPNADLENREAVTENISLKPEMIRKFKQVLQAFKRTSVPHTSPLHLIPEEINKPLSQNNDEQTLQMRQNLEKMGTLLKKKDNRINELLHYEYSAKKAIEHKTWQHEALEKEKLQVKRLEKENEKQSAALSESHNKIVLLETAVNALQSQMETTVDALQSQIEALLSENKQLSTSLQEQELAHSTLTFENESIKSHCHQQEQKIALELDSKLELEAEIKALYKQFQTLRAAFESQKHAIEREIEAKKSIEEQLAKVEEEKNHLKHLLQTCQDEVFTIKQLVSKGMRDAKDIENRYCEAVSEKVTTLAAFHQQQREFDKQHTELIETKNKLKISSEREKEERARINQELFTSKQRNKLLEEKLTQLNNAKNALEDKLDLLSMKNEVIESERDHLQKTNENLANGSSILSEQLSQQLELLRQSMHDHAAFQAKYEQAQEEINTQQAHLEEKQIQLDEAHQHLAKKVREAALLNEQVEEFTLQVADIDNVREALQEASCQLQNDLQREEKEKTELIEKVQLLEDEIKKLEERWLYAEHRSQQATDKIVELEKIEKRHTQLQSLLSGFGPLPGVNDVENKINVETRVIEKSPPLQFGSPLPLEDAETSQIHEEVSKAYPNLFDLPQTSGRSKQNLFD